MSDSYPRGDRDQHHRDVQPRRAYGPAEQRRRFSPTVRRARRATDLRRMVRRPDGEGSGPGTAPRGRALPPHPPTAHLLGDLRRPAARARGRAGPRHRRALLPTVPRERPLQGDVSVRPPPDGPVAHPVGTLGTPPCCYGHPQRRPSLQPFRSRAVAIGRDEPADACSASRCPRSSRARPRSGPRWPVGRPG